MATPDVELEVLTRVGALAGAPDVVLEGTSRNAWPGPERPSKEGGIPLRVIFAQLTPASVNDLHSSGRMRSFEVQLLIRGARNRYAETLHWATRIYDAVDLSGAWESASGAKWMDLRCADAAPLSLGPGESDAEYFALNLRADLDG